jgi:pimeloyl-ACP methyl ester carboxylesterase
MKNRIKRWLLILFMLFIMGFAVLNVIAYNQAYSMMHFTSNGTRTRKPEDLSFWTKIRVIINGVNVPRPISQGTPSELAHGSRTLLINGPDNITLETWYCDQGEETPLIILFHGYSAKKTNLLSEARIFLGLGVSVLLVDFRGSGGSSESYTTIGMREGDDVSAVVRYANNNLSHSAIILFGQSMGAVAILRAIHEYGVTPDAVILEAVFDTMLNTVRNRFAAMGIPSFPSAQLLIFWGGRQWGFDGFAHNPVDYARSVKCPALFMHGVDDPRAPIVEGRRVFEAVPGPKEFKAFESVRHEAYASIHSNEWKNAVAGIINRAENKHMHGTPYSRP